VVHKSVRVAGNKLDEAIANFLRRSHSLLIGDQTAEDVKLKIGTALPLNPEQTMDVKGRDVVSGLPETVKVSSSQIAQALRPELMRIIATVKAVLEETPPELASDIIDKGVVMTGGTA